jgi:D-alanine-D-alanine ligase
MERNLMVGILFNVPAREGEPNWLASVDVLQQVEAIEKALQELGHSSCRLPFAGDLKTFLLDVERISLDLVFNLCETVKEDPTLIGHPAAVLELLNIPFTGSPAFALMLSTDKLLSKQLFLANNIRTPAYAVYEGEFFFHPTGLRFPVILKPRFQDASNGIDQDSVCRNALQLKERARLFYEQYGPLVIEEFIDGREFNVSVLGYPETKILPIGEIDFSAFPDDLYQIVGYRAKWDSSSFEYHNTPRTFTGKLTVPVLRAIQKTALECFRIFMLRDYGRIDIRLDCRQRPYVLEANANPCLSPDAGFAAAAAQEQLAYSEIIMTIINGVLWRMHQNDIHQTAYQG